MDTVLFTYVTVKFIGGGCGASIETVEFFLSSCCSVGWKTFVRWPTAYDGCWIWEKTDIKQNLLPNGPKFPKK